MLENNILKRLFLSFNFPASEIPVMILRKNTIKAETLMTNLRGSYSPASPCVVSSNSSKSPG